MGVELEPVFRSNMFNTVSMQRESPSHPCHWSGLPGLGWFYIYIYLYTLHHYTNKFFDVISCTFFYILSLTV